MRIQAQVHRANYTYPVGGREMGVAPPITLLFLYKLNCFSDGGILKFLKLF